MENQIPKIGTKEFNDLASACFGGKPKQETAVEFQTQQIGILVSKLFNDEISKAEFHFQRFEICEQAKEIEKQQIIDFVNWLNSEDAEDLILDLILIGELNKKPTTKELLEIYKNK